MSNQSNGESRAEYENKSFQQVSQATTVGSTGGKRRSRVSAFGLAYSRDVEVLKEYPIDMKGEFGPLERSFCVYHFQLHIKLPMVEFEPADEDSLQFRYPPNLAANIVKEVRLMFNGNSSLLLADTHILNLYEQYFQSDHMNPVHQEQLGTNYQLNSFTTRKEPLSLLIDLPVLSSPDQPFPIYYTNAEHETFVRATLRRRLLDLIQLANIRDGEPILVPTTEYHKYLPRLRINGQAWYGGPPELTDISLFVRHVYLTRAEKQFYYKALVEQRDNRRKSDADSGTDSGAKSGLNYNIKYFTRIQTDGLSCDSEKNLLIPLECLQLSQGVFLLMQSSALAQNHDYSNYTDANGQSPVDQVSIIYDQEEVGGPYPETVLTRFSGAPVQPYQHGYHGLGMGVGLTDIAAIEHGNFFKFLNAKLKVRLRPLNSRDYQSHVYLMCAGRFVIYMDDETPRLQFLDH